MHSRRTDPIKRSAYPFCQGERIEVGITTGELDRIAHLFSPFQRASPCSRLEPHVGLQFTALGAIPVSNSEISNSQI